MTQPGPLSRSGRARLGYAIVVSIVAVIAGPRPASACPDCEVGRRARREVWHDGFAANLGAAMVPLLAIGGLCAGIEAADRRAVRRRRGPTETPPARREGGSCP
jgi:hypothetical protein